VRRCAVIFDLDGTLVDSLADLGDSTNAVLSAEGFPAHPLDAYRHFVGDGIVNLMARALPCEARTEAVIARCTERLRHVYASRWDGKTTPYMGIHAALRLLRDADCRLGVLTNKPQAMARLIVERFFADAGFEVLLGAEAGFPRKPDPSGAIEVGRRLGAPADRCVYVGDTATDMRTAHAAGMAAVGVLWGFRDADELNHAGADRLVEAPLELGPVVAELLALSGTGATRRSVVP
jgi:phosphoglycolate phosphatase